MRSSLSRFSTAGVHLLAVSLLPVLVAPVSGEAQLALNWTINSSNHDGFVIERREASTGSFARVAIIAPTQSSYVDATISDGNTYCYRVRAFNEAGYSRSTNEACASTTKTMALAVVRSGTGSGSVSSSPTGIQCGSDCLTRYPVGTSVRLTATAALGSTFAGWSGDGDCSDSAVTMNTAKTCTAIFNTAVAPAVTISATDPSATEAGPTAATFRLTRTGNTASSLTVNYTVTGTAVSGIDYVALPRQVTIPAGASTASIHVTPINDTRMEANQTVIVTLASSAAYTIGSPRSATVTIVSNE